MDLVASVERLPGVGETVAATGLEKMFGGKGANQAVSAARQGARVYFIGCVGGDPEGRAYRKRLQSEGIGVSGIAVEKGSLTGSALIGVDRRGQNLIMVAPAANGRVSAAMVRRHRAKIQQADLLLSQFEVPMEAIVEAVRMAQAAAVPVILNPSPFNREFPWGELPVACVIVNEAEARPLLGPSGAALLRRERACRGVLRRLGIGCLIVTRGGSSTLCFGDRDGGLLEVPALKVSPVDTVGAGDAFAGALAAAMARGEPLARAVMMANGAGGLATLRFGAQESIPSRRQTLRALSGRLKRWGLGRRVRQY